MLYAYNIFVLGVWGDRGMGHRTSLAVTLFQEVVEFGGAGRAGDAMWQAYHQAMARRSCSRW